VRSLYSLLIGGVLLILAAAPTNAITIMAGKNDDFAAPIDLADPSSEIQTALSQAQTLVEQTGGRSQQPFIHEERANLASLTGDDATHQRELREAHRLFAEMSATGHAERLAKELGL